LLVIIQCDFDGTVISNNLSVLIRERFAPARWRSIEADYLEGRLTVEESNRRQYALIKQSKEELQAFVRRHVDVRPGFAGFAADCESKGDHVVIVSSGLDFYIEVVLGELGMSGLERYCATAGFSEKGIRVTYRSHSGDVIEDGFKVGYLNWLRQRDKRIFYVGDGTSDFKAARHADYVFATGNLARLLKEEQVSWSCFADFNDIRKKLSLLES
jgi:2,3-diketo-5-methylthio-1-phosphopentane phosphatase